MSQYNRGSYDLAADKIYNQTQNPGQNSQPPRPSRYSQNVLQHVNKPNPKIQSSHAAIAKRQSSIQKLKNQNFIALDALKLTASQEMRKIGGSFQVKTTGEDTNLMGSGGFSKLGEKIRSKVDVARSRQVDLQSNLGQWIQNQIGKVNQYLAKMQQKTQKQDQRLNKIEQKIVKNDQRVDKIQKSQKNQTGDINNILSLIEGQRKREDYRKTMKMIQELRQNILQMHQEIGEIKVEQVQSNSRIVGAQLNTKMSTENQKKIYMQIQERIKNDIDSKMQAKICKLTQETIQALQKQLRIITDKFEQTISKMKESNNKQEVFQSSNRVFLGKMTSFRYQQRIQKIVEGQSKLSEPVRQQQSPTLMFESMYFIDDKGYLLDKNKCYIQDAEGLPILLSPSQIKLLEQHNLL